MNALRNLPTPLKIAIPFGVIIMLVAIFMLTNSRDTSVTIKTSSNPAQVEAWKWRLEQDGLKGIESVQKEGSSTWELRVPEISADKAKLSIDASSLRAALKSKGASACPQPSAFANNRQNEIFRICEYEAKVQDRVMSPDVLAAKATVIIEDNPDFSGAKELSKVTVTLYVDPNATAGINATELADKVAMIVPGGSTERVVISTYDGRTLWNGARNATPNMGVDACAPNKEPVDITTKQVQVEDCQESRLLNDVNELMGGPGRAVATVNVRLNASSVSSVTRETSSGAVTALRNNTSSQDGASNSSSSTEKEPSERQTTTDTIAGSISWMSVTITLDERYASPEIVTAVKQIAANYTREGRDPAPSVSAVKFGTAGDSSTTAGGASATGAPSTTPAPATPQSIPSGTRGISTTMVILVLIGAVIFAFALLMMWRRNAREAAQRAALEREVQQGQRMFQSFAASNPDDMAQDIMELLGAPPASRVPANN